MDAPLPPTTLTQPAPTAKWGDKLHHKGINVFLIVIGSVLFLGVNITAYYFGIKSSGGKISLENFAGGKSSNLASQDNQKTGFNFFKKDKVVPVKIQPGLYACDPNGICNNYSDPKAMECPATYATKDCYNICKDPKNRCKK